jgi:hypothetical protein
MHPDIGSWLAAEDRDETKWFRELGAGASAVLATLRPSQHPLALAASAFQKEFGTRPTTLICPGEQFTEGALARALDLGLQLVGSYYLALRRENRYCWTHHVCAPYLDRPDAAWFDSGLPVVGYFHDRELVLEGVEWMSRELDRWQEVGATRFIDYRELSAVVGRYVDLAPGDDQPRLRRAMSGTPDLVRPPVIRVG